MRSVGSLLVPLAFCLACMGCGGDWGTAGGTVTLDDVPLKEGLITFHPAEGEGATAYGRIVNGEFTVNTGQKAGLKTGKWKVSISASTIPTPGTTEVAKLLTPPRYAKPDTSKLEAEIKSGSNPLQFNMTSKP